MDLKIYIETYGCQMNVADSQVASAILKSAGCSFTDNLSDAGVILINTCSVRDNAEKRVLGRLDVFRLEKKKRKGLIVGVLGCMAQRLKEKLLENPAVDFTLGPDSYRSLPAVLSFISDKGGKMTETNLSTLETYSDIQPVRTDDNGVSAFISIMRGCNNLCSYCIVPFTRGRERSRDPKSIVAEAKQLVKEGYKEVTLLGQNVDS
ncbi:MAG: radical SAM protein, partial [Bacteroidales bacterium]|nr:radical SAM protein [Bacteroidales bacterium]